MVAKHASKSSELLKINGEGQQEKRATGTQTEEENVHGECKRNADRLSGEMVELRRTLAEKSEFATRLQDQHAQIDGLRSNELAIMRQRVENSNQVIESQKHEIVHLKSKLSAYHSLNSSPIIE